MGNALGGAQAPGESLQSAELEPGPSVRSPGSPSLIERVAGSYRAVWKFLGRRALARATLAVPRTARFMRATATSHEVSEGLPAPKLSLGLVAGVAMDEALLAMAMAPSRFPRRADFAGEHRARRGPANVLAPGLDQPSGNVSPHSSTSRVGRRAKESRMGAWPRLRTDHL